MLEKIDRTAGGTAAMPTAGGRRVSQLIINLYESGVCEMLISGDEGALRAAMVRNLAKIAAILRT